MDEMTDFQPDVRSDADPDDEAVALLVSRAIKRGDRSLASDLAAIPHRSEAAEYVLVEADCPALTRIAAVCDPVETLAWRRAMVQASVRSDLGRARALLELAERRCAG